MTSFLFFISIAWLQEGQFFTLAKRPLDRNHSICSSMLVRALMTAARSKILAIVISDQFASIWQKIYSVLLPAAVCEPAIGLLDSYCAIWRLFSASVSYSLGPWPSYSLIFLHSSAFVITCKYVVTFVVYLVVTLENARKSSRTGSVYYS